MTLVPRTSTGSHWSKPVWLMRNICLDSSPCKPLPPKPYKYPSAAVSVSSVSLGGFQTLPVAFSLNFGWHDGQWWWLEYTDVSSNGNDWNPSGPRADMTPLPAFGQRFEFELEEESVSSLPASSWSTERKLLTGLGDCFGSVAAPADGDRIR